VESQAIANLLALYQEAVVAEDSDRLHALLAPPAALAQAQSAAASPARRQDPTGAFADLAAFQEAMSTIFRQHTVTALAIPPATVEVAPDQSSITFLEVESTLDPQTLAQHTRVYRTTWGLAVWARGWCASGSARSGARGLWWTSRPRACWWPGPPCP
jgi:hypothetical protein